MNRFVKWEMEMQLTRRFEKADLEGYILGRFVVGNAHHSYFKIIQLERKLH